jgi:hypothetical protein
VDFAATSRQIGKKDLWLALFALAILPGSRATQKLFRVRSRLLGSLPLTIAEIPPERRAIQNLAVFLGIRTEKRVWSTHLILELWRYADFSVLKLLSQNLGSKFK